MTLPGRRTEVTETREDEHRVVAWITLLGRSDGGTCKTSEEVTEERRNGGRRTEVTEERRTNMRSWCYLGPEAFDMST